MSMNPALGCTVDKMDSRAMVLRTSFERCDSALTLSLSIIIVSEPYLEALSIRT